VACGILVSINIEIRWIALKLNDIALSGANFYNFSDYEILIAIHYFQKNLMLPF
jgi:hypothetical protein